MKKIFTLTVLATLSFYVMASEPSIWDGTTSAFDVSGEKGDTEENPILIESAAQLAYLAQQVHAGEFYEGKFFKLTTDIDLNNQEWLPIGFYNNASIGGRPFKGSFDGGGHKVFNLSITKAAKALHPTTSVEVDMRTYALFGAIEGVSGNKRYIKNLGIESGNIGVADYTVAGIVGWAQAAVISECYNKAELNGRMRVGGIIGQTTGAGTAVNVEVINCYNNGNLKITRKTSGNGAEHTIGGIIARTTTASVSNCYNVGTITADGDYSLDANKWGGLVGDLNANITFVNSYYLETVVTGGNGQGNSYTQAQLLDPIFVQTINNDQDPVRWIADSESINSGFPILFWEKEGVPTALVDMASKQQNLNNYHSIVSDLATITFNNEKSGYVTLKIYDISGNEVIGAYNGMMQKGTQSLQVDLKKIKGGVYIYILTTPTGKGANKMIVK